MPCPFCHNINSTAWATERGYSVVRCGNCYLLYVSPIPMKEEVESAVRTGHHKNIGLNVKSRAIPKKKQRYVRVLRRMFSDFWEANQPVTWVDVGCGYGELLEAVNELAQEGSRILGFEPMQPKAKKAKARGLDVINDYLSPGVVKADVISVVDVFSHIPDFHSFLAIVVSNLNEHGVLFLETGNLADLESRDQFSGELGLPDHLVFAGESTIRGYLEKAGFEIEAIEFERIDGLLNFFKIIVKRLLGQPVIISVPYTSSYRQILIRARLRKRKICGNV